MNGVVIINKEELKEELGGIRDELLADFFERAIAKVIELHPPGREVMTVSQLAARWQVTRQSILRWVRREDFPLPVHYCGGEPRFHLAEVDAWSRSEAVRKLAKERDITDTVQ